MGEWGEVQKRVCMCGRGRGAREGAIDGGKGDKGQSAEGKRRTVKGLVMSKKEIRGREEEVGWEGTWRGRASE